MLVFLSVKFTFYDPSIRQCLFTLHPGGQTKHVQLNVKVIKIDKWLILDPSTSFKRVCLLSPSPHKKPLIYLLIAKKKMVLENVGIPGSDANWFWPAWKAGIVLAHMCLVPLKPLPLGAQIHITKTGTNILLNVLEQVTLSIILYFVLAFSWWVPLKYIPTGSPFTNVKHSLWKYNSSVL